MIIKNNFISKYTPYGIDVNPEVDIIGIIPSKAKSLAFVV